MVLGGWQHHALRVCVVVVQQGCCAEWLGGLTKINVINKLRIMLRCNIEFPGSNAAFRAGFSH